MHVATFAAGDKHAPTDFETRTGDSPCDTLNSDSYQFGAELPPTIRRAILRITAERIGRLWSCPGAQRQRNLLVELVRCANWQRPHTEIRIGNTFLANRLGISIATVKRGLHDLTKSGWITREQLRSTRNKFVGSDTLLTPAAIASLGLNEPLPALPARAAHFFRGADVSHTIGILGIQSSSKRQQTQQAGAGPSEMVDPSGNLAAESQKPNTVYQGQKPSPESSAKPTAPEAHKPEEAVKAVIEPKIYCTAKRGNIITLPRSLAPLLLVLAPHQICHLMAQAGRAGHRLEDITILCEKSILAAKSPMAYIRKLIACDKDWAWVRQSRDETAVVQQNDDQAALAATAQKQAQSAFLRAHAGTTLASKDDSRMFAIDSLSCTKQWLENGVVRSGSYVVTQEFMDAVADGRLRAIDAIQAQAISERWVAQAKCSRPISPRPRSVGRARGAASLTHISQLL